MGYGGLGSLGGGGGEASSNSQSTATNTISFAPIVNVSTGAGQDFAPNVTTSATTSGGFFDDLFGRGSSGYGVPAGATPTAASQSAAFGRYDASQPVGSAKAKTDAAATDTTTLLLWAGGGLALWWLWANRAKLRG